MNYLLRQMPATPFGASSDGEQPLTLAQATTAAASSSRPCVFVHNGQSIQAALDAAQAGTTVYVDPGIYHESLAVHKADIQLIGLVGPNNSHVMLLGSGQGSDGVDVDSRGNGFAMRFIEVHGFSGDGVHLDQVDNFRLTHLLLVSNTDSGIAANASTHGTIQFTEEQGQPEAGIALNGSSSVLVTYNRTHGNVVGVEVVNSSDVCVQRNVVSNNTTGIVVALLPGGTGINDRLGENYVVGNNHQNFAAPGTVEAAAVQGTGILLLGANQTSVLGNLVMSNQTLGIGVVSVEQLYQAYGASSPSLLGFDLSAHDNHIAYNWVHGNGFNSRTPSLPQGADLVWDGFGVGNSWTNNSFGTRI